MKEKKLMLQLDRYEQGLIVKILNEKRNELIRQKSPTDFVDEVLLKTIRAPEKSLRTTRYCEEAR